MGKSKLFESWSFKMELPKPFDDPKYSGGKDFAALNTMLSDL